jgi:hypothetical protein
MVWSYIDLTLMNGLSCNLMQQHFLILNHIFGLRNMRTPYTMVSTGIYYPSSFVLSKDTLSCLSQLHLQSLAPTPVSRRVAVRQAAVVKIIAESLSQHDEKHVVTLLSRIRVGIG